MLPWPPALPRATTAFPALTTEELPTGTVVGPDASCSWINGGRGWRAVIVATASAVSMLVRLALRWPGPGDRRRKD